MRKKKKINQLITYLVYGLIGVISSLTLFLAFYWSLRLNASISNLIQNFYEVPLYFWPYVFLTIGTLVLFGINIPLLIYRWRRYGFPKLNKQAGGGVGTIIGILASACPVCGSTLLSFIGITGGLAAFPLAGLELKAVSFGLMALPVFLTGRELSRFNAGIESCPTPQDASFKAKDKNLLFLLIGILMLLGYFGWQMLVSDPIFLTFTKNSLSTNQVLPDKVFQSKIILGDSVVKLVERGVIDRDKFLATYQERGSLPSELKDVFDRPSARPILLTRQNANYYVNLLWPLGLANYMSSNKQSPINGKSLFNFASTGGWDLGKEENGGAYFNKFIIVELTPAQETLVTRIAQNTYRPCCNNSTFFQDCNHGSALMGLLELGASQGLSEDELYQEALAFNSFWFPQTYLDLAKYFEVKEKKNWDKIDPKIILGQKYSSGQGYQAIRQEMESLGILEKPQGGPSCGV